MEQVFTGFISLLDIKGKPGTTVKIMASAIPFCGSAAYAAVAAQHRTQAGTPPQRSADVRPALRAGLRRRRVRVGPATI